MTDSSATPHSSTTYAGQSSLARLTEHLFQQVAEESGSAVLRQTMTRLNRELVAIRSLEAKLFPDLEAEYGALSAAWERRDYPLLRMLLRAYFDRRKPLLAQAKDDQRPN